MPRLRKPSGVTLWKFLQTHGKLDLTYPAIGATATAPPDGFTVDHTRVELGKGEAVFRAAREALEQWKPFELGWLEAWPTDAPLEPGTPIAILARSLGLWWLSACRIVYIVDEDGPTATFGFAYGTLPQHMGAGEERFQVEWDKATDTVWYDILAFSQARSVLAQLGYPWFRHVQRRFRRDSAAAMLRAVNQVTGAAHGSR